MANAPSRSLEGTRALTRFRASARSMAKGVDEPNSIEPHAQAPSLNNGAEVRAAPLHYSNWRQRVWQPACDAVGLPGFQFHDLGRNAATALVLHGVDVKTVRLKLASDTQARKSRSTSTRRRRAKPIAPPPKRSARRTSRRPLKTRAKIGQKSRLSKRVTDRK